MIINQNVTYILDGYRVQCEGIVTTWEFCYHTLGISSVTFHPGIWKKERNASYSLIQSNTVTFTPNGTNDNSCQNYTLPVTEQFTAPSGSVVGLYSNLNVQLLHTNAIKNKTYQVIGNRSKVYGNGQDVGVHYNIAIRVHLSKLKFLFALRLYVHAYYICT